MDMADEVLDLASFLDASFNHIKQLANVVANELARGEFATGFSFFS